MVTLSPDQELRLIQHAAAMRVSLPEALDALLATPPSATRRRWTDAELDLLRNPRNQPRDIARRTDRTVTAVSNRRSQLARDENRPDLQVSARRRCRCTARPGKHYIGDHAPVSAGQDGSEH